MSGKRTTNQKASRESYQLAYSELSQLIREADPIALIAAGAPADEYGPEVSTILARLRETRSVDDVQRMVHEVFVRWFGADIAGSITDYSDLSKNIWAWRTRASEPKEHC